MFRKKGFYFLIVFIFSLSLLIGCGGGNQSENIVQDTSLQDIKEKGYFVLGINNDIPPLSYIDRNGEIAGFDLELMTEVAKRMEVEIQVESDYESGLESLKTGNIDILNGLFIGDVEDIDYSNPYINNGIVILARSDLQHMDNNLENKKVGVALNSKGHSILTSGDTFSAEEISTFETNQEVLTQLGIGTIDAAVVEGVFGRYMIKERPSEFRIINEIESDFYGMGFRKGEDNFREEVNRILGEMKEDGFMDSISRKWFGNSLVLE